MSIPWRAISLTSLVSAYIATQQAPLTSKLLFAGAFVASWAVLAAGWGVYTVFLWPFFLSPLRHLPEPKGGSWIHGQWARIVKDPTGVPQTECTSGGARRRRGDSG